MANQETLEGLANITQGLANDPELRPQFMGLVEKKFGIVAPDVVASRKQIERDAAQEKRIKELEERIASDKLATDLAKARESAISKHGLAAEDVKEVEKIMLDRKIGSYDTAAEFLAQSRQLAPPSAAAVNVSWDKPSFPDSVKTPAGLKNWAFEQASAAITELNQRRGAA